jgi:hypothetical protein
MRRHPAQDGQPIMVARLLDMTHARPREREGLLVNSPAS